MDASALSRMNEKQDLEFRCASRMTFSRAPDFASEIHFHNKSKAMIFFTRSSP